ncbi:monocarboxylate transporter 10-like [Trichogramma pretiosum]|uniref:monocarboxylate transporter 10-like n=1 Tax=Trichogramma pretiosum TaxID=7493 RepID=UPI0006C945A7|nr:monocarboxylate transporter 10-like [Trichogramma pretiosum]
MLNEGEEGDKKKPVIVPASKASHENGSVGKDESAKLNGTGSGTESIPPDGGVRAWSIMVASFLVNGVLFGIINSYSQIYKELETRLVENKETEVASRASLVGSLTIGTTFFLSFFAGILTDKIGIQKTTFIGGAVAVSGLLLSSFVASKVELLCLTYGIMYGTGASLAYTPSLVILGHYFKRHLGFVNGVVTLGSSTFTIIMPYIIDLLLRETSLETTFKCLAIPTSIVMLSALMFKPIPGPAAEEQVEKLKKKKFGTMLKEAVNVSIWKRKKYLVWATVIPIALFGYFIPYVYIAQFVKDEFEGMDDKLPLTCIGISSGIGRLFFGWIADHPRVNRIFLQQFSFFSIGCLTITLAFAKSYHLLLAISLGIGLFDGCFISMIGPIAFDICGSKDASQAIGFLLGMSSIPLTCGPPIAGKIHDITGSYQLPFLLAGVPPILGSLMMTFIYRVSSEPAEEPTYVNDEEVGEARQSLTDLKRVNVHSFKKEIGDFNSTTLTTSNETKNV